MRGTSRSRTSCLHWGLPIVILLSVSGCSTLRWQFPLTRVQSSCPIDSTASQFPVMPAPDGSMGTRYLQTGAVLAGTEFVPTEQKKATERALEFQSENEQLKAEKAQLEQSVADLGQELELDGKALLRAEEEVENAQQQLGTLQNELDNWRKEMFKINERLRNSDQQHVQSLEQLTTLLEDKISLVFEEYVSDHFIKSNQRFLKLEKNRIKNLCITWLDLEKKRANFKITALEHRHNVNIGNLEISTIIDRVDQLDDESHVLIDYKTGRPSIYDWFGDRPSDPQLPLYAATHDKKISGLAFAQVRVDDLRFLRQF